MQTVIAAERGRNLLAVAVVCGRDRELMAPFEAHFMACWPAARIVWALDPADPPPRPCGPSVACAWQSPRRPRAVLDAMTEAASGTAAEWVLKCDVDTAHLSPAWLTEARPDSVLIGCQNGHGWAGMLGLAFAIRRQVLFKIHAGSDCGAPGAESDAIHRAVRHRHLNHVWLWPHAPRSGGLFCSMSDPSKAPLYRSLFSLVHCGPPDRQKAAVLMRSLLPD